MARRFTLVTKDYDDYATDLIGVKKDTYIMEVNPSWNFGGATGVGCGMTVGLGTHGIYELVMPTEDDIVGFDELESVELVVTLQSRTFTGSATGVIIAVLVIPDDFDEGTLNGSAGYCNWNNFIAAAPWAKGAGAVASRPNSYVPEDGVVIWSGGFTGASTIDVQYSIDLSEIADMGETIRIAIFAIFTDGTTGGGGDTAVVNFYSKEHPTSSKHPILRVKYRDYPPEGLEGEDSLAIEPNPDNPEQPMLSWGGTRASDFGGQFLYRDTSPITSVASLTPIATFSSPDPQEYVDDDALVDGTTYWYMVVVADLNNTGDSGLKSNNISFTKPDVVTASLTPSGSQNVGTSISMTVTANKPIKRVYVDWKDGTQSWYEFDVTGTSKTVSHIYDATTSGAVTPDVRVEDSDGFWSSLTPTSNTVTLNDITPTAKVLVNVKRDHVGVEVTLNAALSQPAGSDVTITKYEFKRYGTDSWQDNGTNPIYSFSTTGFSVGVKTASVRITTSSSLQDTDTVDYELEAGDPVEIEFSRNTRVHEYAHDLPFDKEFKAPLEGDGVEYEFKNARKAERVTIHGTSHTPDMASDIGIIRDVWLNDTYIRVRVKNEVEGKEVLYDGKIESDVTIGHSYPNLQNWSFNMVVFNRSEVTP